MLSPVVGDAFGQERVMRSSAELLLAEGHEVFFLGGHIGGEIPRVTGYEIVPGLPDIHFLTKSKESRRLRGLGMAALERIKPDVVHFIDQFDSEFQAEVCRSYPSVITAHLYALTCPASNRLRGNLGMCTKKSGWACLLHNYEQQCLSFFPSLANRAVVVREYLRRRRALRAVRAVIAVSKSVQETLIEDGWPAEKVHLIYNPIASPPAVGTKVDTPKNLLLAASRLVPYKGIELLLQALAALKELEWSLWICGDGPERRNYEAAVARLGLTDRVKFLGHLDYVRTMELMRASTAFLQPNVGPEPFGLAVAEASQLGTPVIVANVPALNEIVRHEDNGLLFPSGDHTQLAAAIRRLLTEPVLAARLGQNGPKRIRELFAPEIHLRKTLELYERVIHGGGDASLVHHKPQSRSASDRKLSREGSR